MSEQTPHNTANLLAITPVTLRRWCEYHAAHLSPGANPPAGQARRFTGRDIEVFKTVKQLRAQGLTVARINEQLASLTFAEIDTPSPSAETENALNAQPGAQETHHAAQLPALVLNDLENRFSAKLAALEQAKEEVKRGRQRDFLLVMMGVVIGVLLVVGLLAVAALMLR